MPRIDYVYICPVCHEEFSTEEDARECCEIAEGKAHFVEANDEVSR